MALSMVDMTEDRCRQTAQLAKTLIERIFLCGKFPGILNVNIPEKGDISLSNARVVPQTVQIYHNVIMEKRDLDGSLCYKIVGDIDLTTAPENSDVACIGNGHVALTPLCWRQTATAAMEHIQGCL